MQSYMVEKSGDPVPLDDLNDLTQGMVVFCDTGPVLGIGIVVRAYETSVLVYWIVYHTEHGTKNNVLLEYVDEDEDIPQFQEFVGSLDIVSRVDLFKIHWLPEKLFDSE